MKKLLFVLSVALALGTAYAEEDPAAESICPKTKISAQNQCLTCHTYPNFKIKESDPREGLIYPDWLVWKNNTWEGYFLLGHVGSTSIADFYEYINSRGISRVTIELFTPGGGVMEAWRIVALIEENKQVHTTTIVRGFAASAGFLIMCAGDSRLVSPTALLMWHEVQSFKMFDISSPSDKEEEARILRFFQDVANDWLVARSRMSKKELDARIKKKEFWLSGK